ncbi:LOW QUALITY PROTEIN: 28S ribosomal protein S22, mitochondrial-like [Erpetoichthys calabaricus]|uniref:LOW QUALITY PROTEIN: 28S ribosomal protein S22, mitochondrial-like n=1 Tax=Erpetoichthys calabaricus TaxID=27687 RepID=UPI0022341B64|nr:LOW QUALITY PROTEIN: 28S ribosomal protein S22, mitochondrial-like [Erpetoichthys calabaricus]
MEYVIEGIDEVHVYIDDIVLMGINTSAAQGKDIPESAAEHTKSQIEIIQVFEYVAQKAGIGHEVVVHILILITGLDLQKVFRPVKMEMKHPSYHLMTDEQLFEVQIQKEQKKPTGQMLQIVPVLPERKPVCDILAVGKVLDGLEKSKYVFTDITFNVPHRERFIVTREPDGTLCKATCVERDWMVQIYFPYKGRQLTAPAVFEEAIRYLQT